MIILQLRQIFFTDALTFILLPLPIPILLEDAIYRIEKFTLTRGVISGVTINVTTLLSLARLYRAYALMTHIDATLNALELAP